MDRTLNRVRLVGLLAATLAAGSLQAAPLNLTGTTVTGTATLNASPLTLLGADSGYQPGAGTGTTAVLDGFGSYEFITDDAIFSPLSVSSLAVDLATNGVLTFTDNTELGAPNGAYTFSFVFAGLTEGIGEVVLDLGLLTAGSVSATVTAPDTVQFTLNGVTFASAFQSFSAQLNTVEAAVPLPGTLALAGLALALMVAPARRRKEV